MPIRNVLESLFKTYKAGHNPHSLDFLRTKNEYYENLEELLRDDSEKSTS